MNHTTPRYRSRKFAQGFGLIEVMVALLIGMFGVLIMMQVFSVSEAQKRTAVSSGDALNTGAIALYSLQSDLRMGGYGFADPKLLGCNLTLRAGVTLVMAPAAINPATITGQDANTDSVLTMYSNTNGAPQGDLVAAAGNTMTTPSAFAAGDWVVVAPVSRVAPCNLTLDQVAGVAGSVLTLTSGSAMVAGSTVFNFGQTYAAKGYAVRGGNLTSCDYTNAAVDCSVPGNWVSLSENVVGLRMQYGRDTAAAGSMDGIVDLYDQTSPAVEGGTNSACAWARISALRFALVVRSTQYEKSAVTFAPPSPTFPSWDGAVTGNPPGSAAAAFTLSTLANWQNYRYKVFQTLVPLRNISWMGVVQSC